jgi:hypothetical protein
MIRDIWKEMDKRDSKLCDKEEDRREFEGKKRRNEEEDGTIDRDSLQHSCYDKERRC